MSLAEDWKGSELTGEIVFYYQFHSALSYRGIVFRFTPNRTFKSGELCQDIKMRDASMFPL